MTWLDPTRPVPDVRTALPGPAGQAIIDGDLAVTSGSLPRA
jgi:4-aminobutyrate aminotransferase